MATTGAKTPTAASSTAEAPHSANAWTTPENLYGAGTAAITAATFDANDQSEILRAYGFDFSVIPDGSTIDGVQVVIGGAYYATAICALDLAQLLTTGGALTGTNQYATPVNLTTGGSNYTKGGATDKWGNALDAAWVKNSNFGVGIGIKVGASNNCDVFIDSVTMEVWYTPPALNYVHEGGIYGTGYAASTRTVEVTKTGTLSATRYDDTENYYQSGVPPVDYTHQGAVFSTGYAASTRTVEKVVTGAVYSTQYRTHDKTVERVAPGTVYATDSWAAEFYFDVTPIGLDFTYQGAVIATETWASRLRMPVLLYGSTYISPAAADPTTNRLSTYHSGPDFDAGRISDDTNPLPGITIDPGGFTEVEFSVEIDIATSDVLRFRVTDGGQPLTTYDATPQYTATSNEYLCQGAIASEAAWASDRMVDVTKQGAIYQTDSISHERTILRNVEGAVFSTDAWIGDRTILRSVTGAVFATETWDSYYAGSLKDYTWAGQVYSDQTWASPRPIDITREGAIYSTDTWSSEKYKDVTYESSLYSTDTWASTRTKESFIDQGITAEGFHEALRMVEKLVEGTIYSDQAWTAYLEGNLLDFVCEGLITGEYEFNHTRTILRNVLGSLYGTETWASDRMKDVTRQGALYSTQYRTHIRNIEKLVQGSKYATETWSHIIGRQMVYLGTIRGEDTWVSPKGFHKIVTGAISAEEFWNSDIGIAAYFEPDEIYQVPARTAIASVSSRSGDFPVPSRTPTDTVATRTPIANY